MFSLCAFHCLRQVAFPDARPPPDRDITLRQFQDIFNHPPTQLTASTASHDVPQFFRAAHLTKLAQGVNKELHEALTAATTETEIILMGVVSQYAKAVTDHILKHGFDM